MTACARAGDDAGYGKRSSGKVLEVGRVWCYSERPAVCATVEVCWQQGISGPALGWERLESGEDVQATSVRTP